MERGRRRRRGGGEGRPGSPALLEGTREPPMAPQAVWFVAINGSGNVGSGVSNGHSADIAFEELRGALGARPGAGPAADAALLRLPPLKVSGGLDGLLAVGDEAARRYADVLGALARMRRTHSELARACGMVPDERAASQAGAEPDAPPVDGRPAADALLDFAWDAAAMPARKPLAELVAMAARRVADLDEELRAHAADAAAKRGDATALAKRLGGPIGTRDLAVVVRRQPSGGERPAPPGTRAHRAPARPHNRWTPPRSLRRSTSARCSSRSPPPPNTRG